MVQRGAQKGATSFQVGHRTGGQLRDQMAAAAESWGEREAGRGHGGPWECRQGVREAERGLVRGGRGRRTAQETEQVLEKWKKKELIGGDEELSIKLMRSEIRRDTRAGCHLETGDSKGSIERRNKGRSSPKGWRGGGALRSSSLKCKKETRRRRDR